MAIKKTERETIKNLRTYKILDADYSKAMLRSLAGRHQLSSLISEVVVAFANGADLIKFLNDNQKHSSNKNNS